MTEVKRLCFLGILVLLLSPLRSEAEDRGAPPVTAPEFPIYVMNKIDDQYRGAKSHGVMTMSVKTRHFERTITVESWTLGKEYSLMRILKPLKERGTATLKAKNDLYTYLKKTNRTIKITSAMMGGAWMGSHFTNDDLVRDSRLDRDFTISLDPASVKPEATSYRFMLIPKKDAAVVWGKIVVVVRKADLQPIKQTFYDEKQKPVRELDFSDHRQIGGRTMPMKMAMTPLDSSGEYTLVRWEEIDFTANISKSFFSLQNLKSF
jgi:hypothetical protein